MHLYDPANGIRYVHLASEPEPAAASDDRAVDCTRLPAGYANHSPRTYLGRLGHGDADPETERELRRA